MNRPDHHDWYAQLDPETRGIVERLWEPPLVHPRYADARARVEAGLSAPPTKPLVTLTGPTRSGKSTLLEVLAEDLEERWETLTREIPHARPVVPFEVTASPSGIFSFQACFVDPLLDELNVPSKARRVASTAPGPDVRIVRTAARRLSLSEAVNAAVKACKLYEVKVLLVDEGHHFGMVRSDEDYKRNLEALKTFTNRTRVRLVLAGTHDLESVRDMSAQMIGRSTNARLPRYRLEDARDVAAFRTVVRKLRERLPDDAPALEDESPMLMRRSLGLVGILVDWLLTAVAQAAARRDLPKLLAYLERTALDDDDLEAMAIEIEEGEAARADEIAARALRRAERLVRSGERRTELAKLQARAQGRAARGRGIRVGRRRPAIDPAHVRRPA